MFKISAEVSRGLQAILHEQLVREIYQYLTEVLQREELTWCESSDQGLRFAQDAAARAMSYGFTTDRQIAKFVMLSALFGSEFHEMHAWARELLSQRDEVEPEVLIELLVLEAQSTADAGDLRG
ncbi:hypothetical protein [Polyangium mundeleinium]|uniref:Uncharacterized protein n=1 Tax=Polyangium mundeleinium TaxID=2995306 RepID=A0ABT5EFS7_9BACT|nr:hypothetical protein [Polyangium mundeleinium]MDC0740687.1 hypothetical protein [Polyangium mundeleinium]